MKRALFVIINIIAAAGVIALITATAPRCGPTSPHGPRNALGLIGGCP